MGIPRQLKGILSRDPDVRSGDVFFTGTRIPVLILLDNAAAGTPMDEFDDSHPSLSPNRVRPVLDWENRKAPRAITLRLPLASMP